MYFVNARFIVPKPDSSGYRPSSLMPRAVKANSGAAFYRKHYPLFFQIKKPIFCNTGFSYVK